MEYFGRSAEVKKSVKDKQDLLWLIQDSPLHSSPTLKEQNFYIFLQKLGFFSSMRQTKDFVKFFVPPR